MWQGEKCQLPDFSIFTGRYWEVALGGITVGSSSVQITAKSAIIDSGTTAIVMQNSDAASIHSVSFALASV